MATALVILLGFYAGGAVATALLAAYLARVLAMCGLTAGRSAVLTVARIAALWPVAVPRIAFLRIPALTQPEGDAT